MRAILPAHQCGAEKGRPKVSNPLKAIGKVFKGAVKVLKKIALPALAIGAVVLTGGAALGVLPALGGSGGLLAGIGIKGALAGVLTSAAKAATFGAIGSALTGGNIVKGATAGFVTGGILGGASAALGGAKGLGTAAASGSSSGASNALNVIDNGKIAAMGSGATGVTGAATTATQGLGTAVASSGLGSSATAGLVGSAPVPSSGGILGWMNQNPVVSGMMVQGLGQGLMAREQAKQQERDAAQTAANYSDTSGLPQYRSQGNSYANASDVFNGAIYAGKRVTLDPKTGLKVVNG